MTSKILLSAVVTEIVILSLLRDAIPASAAAVVPASAARHRRQLSESDHPTVDEVHQDGPSRSLLVRAWLRAAAARAAADRQRSDDDDDDVEWTNRWKRQIDNDDIYLVRRRMAPNSDVDLDLLHRNSVSPTQRRNFNSFCTYIEH